MEGKENMDSGVRVIGSEPLSNYHVGPRPDAPPVTVSPSAMTPTSSGMFSGVMEKKKRGRPRKYAPDDSAAGVLSPAPISSSVSPSTVTYSIEKRGKGRSWSKKMKNNNSVETNYTGNGGASCDGAHFTPHVITVNAGEDVTARVISFCQQGPRAICILSANGTVSNATLRQSDTSGGTLTYEGRFEIVNLCGSFTPTEREGTRYRAGGLSVSLSSPNGQVVGGCVAGLLVAAGPVQIIVASFLPSSQPEHKPKKRKPHHVSESTTPVSALPAPSDKNDASNIQEQTVPGPTMQNITHFPFTRDYSMQDSRRSTDINISLPEGMQ